MSVPDEQVAVAVTVAPRFVVAAECVRRPGLAGDAAQATGLAVTPSVPSVPSVAVGTVGPVGPVGPVSAVSDATMRPR